MRNQKEKKTVKIVIGIITKHLFVQFYDDVIHFEFTPVRKLSQNRKNPLFTFYLFTFNV